MFSTIPEKVILNICFRFHLTSMSTKTLWIRELKDWPKKLHRNEKESQRTNMPIQPKPRKINFSTITFWQNLPSKMLTKTLMSSALRMMKKVPILQPVSGKIKMDSSRNLSLQKFQLHLLSRVTMSRYDYTNFFNWGNSIYSGDLNSGHLKCGFSLDFWVVKSHVIRQVIGSPDTAVWFVPCLFIFGLVFEQLLENRNTV